MVGGGCFVNAAITGLLVGMFAAAISFTIDTILIPFMVGATASFGISLYLMRHSTHEVPVMRKVILAGLGVVLGSAMAVIGIAAFFLISGF